MHKDFPGFCAKRRKISPQSKKAAGTESGRREKEKIARGCGAARAIFHADLSIPKKGGSKL